MTPADQERFPPLPVTLKNGIEAVIRALSVDDGERLADFYDAVPSEDYRFYCPHPLDREHALKNAELALSPLRVVLVLQTPEDEIGGYAWYRWPNEQAERSGFGICIRRDCQGLGVGKALTARLMEIAESVGPPVMRLTVQKANERALALYRNNGFQVVREQMRAAVMPNGFPPEPEYVMERRVR